MPGKGNFEGLTKKIDFIVDVVLVYILEELVMVKYLLMAAISFRIMRKTMSEIVKNCW